MSNQMAERMAAKTAERRFVQQLESEYRMAPRIAEAILAEAQACLQGSGREVGTGQVRVILARQKEPAGRPVSAMHQVEVVWTIDAGAEDAAVKAAHGAVAMRQVREQRLLDEALEQAAVATQEDLARALHTSLRTIKRDFAEMALHGRILPSRGSLQGIGRGQSHKAQIIARWLAGESFDQLRLSTRHAISSIQRYLRAFVQVVQLQQWGNAPEEISYLLQIGLPLVRDYLRVYAQNDHPACRERLQEQLLRLGQPHRLEKGGQ